MKIQTPFFVTGFQLVIINSLRVVFRLRNLNGCILKCTGEREDCGNIKQRGLIGERCSCLWLQGVGLAISGCAALKGEGLDEGRKQG